MKTFNNFEELKPYYNEQTNTYDFMENGEPIDVEFTFCLVIKANIDARNINALDIDAGDIDARNINALDINALDINALNINAWNINAKEIIFWAVCVAYNNIKCTSIKGSRKNAKYFCLDGEVTIKKD